MNERKTTKPEPDRCKLTISEKQVLSRIFKKILETGVAPTMRQLQTELKEPSRNISEVLNVLESKDRLVRNRETGRIVSVYPLSLLPTDHRVCTEDGKEFFGMCALDALSIPNVFNKDGEIVSQCEWCHEKITIEIVEGDIESQSHPQILIWDPVHVERPAAAKCCPFVNFFCSEKHLLSWEAENPSIAGKGHGTPLERAYSIVKECWSRYGTILRLR